VFVAEVRAISEMHYLWTTPPDQYCNVWEH
jgi:hypothetical protein